MQHVHPDRGVDIMHSDSFRDHFEIAELDVSGVASVCYWANQEPPPLAPSQREVRENCQGWTIRVVRHLVEQGLVTQAWLQSLYGLMEPV